MRLSIMVTVMLAVMLLSAAGLSAQAPQVLSVDPPPHETSAGQTVTVSVTFDTDMNTATINNTSFVINGSIFGRRSGAISYDAGSLTAGFQPTIGFAPGENVEVVLTTAVQSSIGESLAGPYVWSFTGAATGGSGEFEIASTYPVGLMPVELTPADVDGDGDIDLITANKDSDNATVLYNAGDGTFPTRANFLDGNGPENVCLGDFDADGDLDMAIVNKWSDDMRIMRNDGAGSFAQIGAYAVGSNPYGVQTSDFDGDGALDLVVANSASDNISVLRGNGDGTFGGRVNYAVGDFPYNIVTRDFDNDGDIDLAIANRTTNNVSVLMGNADGSFVAQVQYAVGTSPVLARAADLDGDGDADIITGNGSSDDFSVLHNDGYGAFGVRVDFPGGDGSNRPLAGDFDGDGDIDIAAACFTPEYVVVVLNDGSGGLLNPAFYGLDAGATTTCAADFDGDGDLDIAATYPDLNQVVVLTNIDRQGGVIEGFVAASGTGLFGVPVNLFDGDANLVGTIVTDETGWYGFDIVEYGEYTVAIATPLGYQADAEVKAVTLDMANVQIDFAMTLLSNPMNQRGRGYWMHQVNALLSGKGRPHETYDDMCLYMESIRQHFNDHSLNPITVFSVDLGSNCDQRLEALRTVISPKKHPTMGEKAAAHLTALLLNVVSGKVTQWAVISDDNATVSQAVTYCHDLIGSGDALQQERAKDIARMINGGQMVPAGWIDISTPEYAYKGSGEPVLPSRYSLSQNTPNPFNPGTEIGFSLPEAANVRMDVFNVLGRHITTLARGYYVAGAHTVTWNASEYSSGVYLYRFQAGQFTQTRKMVLIK